VTGKKGGKKTKKAEGGKQKGPSSYHLLRPNWKTERGGKGGDDIPFAILQKKKIDERGGKRGLTNSHEMAYHQKKKKGKGENS